MSHRLALSIAICALLSAPAWSRPDLAKIKADYQAASAQVKKHQSSDGSYLDNDPQSPKWLAKKWALAGEWLAASLDASDSVGPDRVQAAMHELEPSEKPAFIALGATTYVVSAPGDFGNFFIMSKTAGHFRVAWSIADQQPVRGKQAEMLAAWRPENARDQRRDVPTAGPVNGALGLLPVDAKGWARFYIDGIYVEPIGSTVPAQVTVWMWDGTHARLLIARRFGVMLDQKVGTRLDGELLKVQQKKEFRTFSSCGQCEGRQVDWIVRVDGKDVADLGETSTVPALDAVDELLFRLIHGRSATDIASPAAIKSASEIMRDARGDQSAKEWMKFPTIGMMGNWTVRKMQDAEIVCFTADESGTNIYKLIPKAGGFFIEDITRSDADCSR